MKAKLVYRSGNKILLPKEGQAALLLMEYLRDYSKEHLCSSIRISDSSDESEADYFIVEFLYTIKETYIDAICYINANLPEESHNQGS